MMNKKRLIILVGISIVVLATAVILAANFLGLFNVFKKQDDFSKPLNYLNSLDPEKTSLAIPELEKIIKSPASRQNEAYAKILLALAYFNIGKPVESAGLFKEVAKNDEYPNKQRALAVYHLIQIANNQGLDFFRQYILNDEPFKSFYTETNADPGDNASLAIRKMAEWEDSLSPSVMANYRIANWYAEKLFENELRPFLTDFEKDEYNKILIQKLQKADEFFAQWPLQIMESGDRGILSSIYLQKGVIYEKHYLVSGISSSKITAENSYKEAAKLHQSVFLPKKLKLEIPFYYAAFLAEIYGKSRLVEIRKLTEPIHDSAVSEIKKDEAFLAFLKNGKVLPEIRFAKRALLMLAKVDPDFKNLLKNLGWSDENLEMKIIALPKKK